MLVNISWFVFWVTRRSSLLRADERFVVTYCLRNEDGMSLRNVCDHRRGAVRSGLYGA
jgi:hypothetical protein